MYLNSAFVFTEFQVCNNFKHVLFFCSGFAGSRFKDQFRRRNNTLNRKTKFMPYWWLSIFTFLLFHDKEFL